MIKIEHLVDSNPLLKRSLSQQLICANRTPQEKVNYKEVQKNASSIAYHIRIGEKFYRSKKETIKKHPIKKSVLERNLKDPNNTTFEIIRNPKVNRCKINMDGDIFESQIECSRKCNMSDSGVGALLRNVNESAFHYTKLPQELDNKKVPKPEASCVWKGTPYLSVRFLAEDLNENPLIVHTWLIDPEDERIRQSCRDPGYRGFNGIEYHAG